MSDPVKKPPKRRMHPDTILIMAQIGFTATLLLAIIGVAYMLLLAKNSAAEKSTLTNILLVLTTLLTVSWNYFFSRQRPNGLPDPNQPPGGINHAPLSTGGTIAVTGNDRNNPG